MPGHNGGFNPFRDGNGEFTEVGNVGGKGRSREGGPLQWKALPKSLNAQIRAAAGRGPAPASMSNGDVRAWYNATTGHVPELNEKWKAEGLGAEDRARRCHEIRHGARVQARVLMEDQAAVKDLEARDQKKYGSPDGPSFAYLVSDWKTRGVGGDDIYESIIGGAARTNAEVNARFAQKGASA